jgi:N-acetyl sugar amidotransferase
MDETDPDITFDENGVCNHCQNWHANRPRDMGLLRKITHIVKERATGEYDCVLGISGGTDSSYLAYLAYWLNLNVLLVHLNDGWNSDEAKWNVKTIIKKTGYDLVEIQVDEPEFRDIVRAYLHAGVVGLEAPTDNCIMTGIHRVVSGFGINNIISGSNWATEGVGVRAWAYPPADTKNIRAIHERFGSLPLKETKLMGLLQKRWALTFRGVREFRLLNYIDYNRSDAIRILAQNWGWKESGRKHCENRYTRFVEGYIYPTRFGFDKRRSHFSALICSGQMTREEALIELKKPAYTQEEFEADKAFFFEKLGLDEFKFGHFMALPIRQHNEFSTHKWSLRLLRIMRPLRRFFR